MRQVRRRIHDRAHSLFIVWCAVVTALVAITSSGACLLHSETTLCEESGLLCPPGWRCAAAQDVCIPSGGCGDGIKSPDEVCDDGNILPGDSCSPDCQSDKPCGDGVVDPGEECDNGATDSAICNSDCTAVKCGDGHLNVTAGEECDNGGLDTPDCNGRLCKLPRCGDFYFNPEFLLPGTNLKEQCDSGGMDTLACDSDCTAPLCGDGHHNPEYVIPILNHSEQCDPGIMTMGVPQDSMDCDSDCTTVMCGDGHTNLTAGEECDDANSDITDACPEGGVGGTCKNAICGDGYVRTGVESCDPGIIIMGMTQDSMSCDSDCTPVVCGDGHTNSAANEQCDDGNNITTDACPKTGPGGCKDARCGDGFVHMGVEQCDPAATGGNSCATGKVCGAVGTTNECQCFIPSP